MPARTQQSISVVQVSVKNGTVRIRPQGNGGAANVIKADLAACNAVVHVIDRVLLPARVSRKTLALNLQPTLLKFPPADCASLTLPTVCSCQLG
jgi:hypothetical protein